MQNKTLKVLAVLTICLAAPSLGIVAKASVIPEPKTFFAMNPVITFDGLATNTEVNGLVVNGTRFNYLVGGIATNGQVIIDGGPGTTNNISTPNIVSIGNNGGVLLLTLPTFATSLGYGFADLYGGTLADATTITLFNGTTNVGSLVYSGSPDPNFTGGFAGIASTVAFNSVDLSFDATSAAAFAVDNLTYTAAAAATPEPGTLLLVASGVAGVIARRRLLLRS